MVQACLKDDGIPTAVYDPNCVHEQPVFVASNGHRAEDFPDSLRASREVLSLPMHPWLDEAELSLVCAKLSAACRRPVLR